MLIFLTTKVTLYLLHLCMGTLIMPKGGSLAEIRNIRNLVHKNWLCIGDFNQVLSHDDKFGFSHRKIEGIEIFKQTLFDLGLCDLEAKGQK
ncbi:hypothetical protein ACB092_11G150200 [Castanea dentata]